MMGKLHTLRRAIERDPEKWFRTVKTLRGGNRYFVVGASFVRREWKPSRGYYFGSIRPPRRDFVRHTLRGLGYKVREYEVLPR